jgi:hypothetical protein
MTVRVLVDCTWSPDGAALFHFAPGEVVTDRDPRSGNGFMEVAVRRGWVEVISDPIASPATTVMSPTKPRRSPGRAKRTAPRRKDGSA